MDQRDRSMATREFRAPAAFMDDEEDDSSGDEASKKRRRMGLLQGNEDMYDANDF